MHIGQIYQPIVKENGVDTPRKWSDGVEVDFTVYSSDMSRTCRIPNYTWTLSTISPILTDVGFKSIQVTSPLESFPTVLIKAHK